jgi:hypothetical protein
MRWTVRHVKILPLDIGTPQFPTRATGFLKELKKLLVYVNNFCRGESVEPGGGSD